jgi:hypothetical protein
MLMKFDAVVRQFGDRPWFDFEMVLLASGEAAPCVHTELYRWRQAGKLIELRRGIFTLAAPWNRVGGRGRFEGALLAGAIYNPSYLSGLWALTRWGLLNADMLSFTCVTARPARAFTNSFGMYSYATLPRDLLFGTVNAPVDGGNIRMALPEKALMDHCFVEGGEWDEARFEALGLSAAGLAQGIITPERFAELAARTGRPRLVAAASAFSRMAAR